jgi:hypothetical protein
MPKKAYLAEHLSSDELKDRYRNCQDSVETRRWHLLWKISLGWTIKNAEIAVGLDYQYGFKILKKYNELGEEGVKNLKKKSGSLGVMVIRKSNERSKLVTEFANVRS